MGAAQFKPVLKVSATPGASVPRSRASSSDVHGQQFVIGSIGCRDSVGAEEGTRGGAARPRPE
jgi:hypothetical protein